MQTFFTKPWLRALSGLLLNLSAAWFGVAFITPHLPNLILVEGIFVLTRNIVFGIVLFVLAAKIEEILET